MNFKLLGLIVGALAILLGGLLLAHIDPEIVIVTLIKGSLGSPVSISDTLKETTPLLLAGLAVFLALRAGQFNIGAEGQLLVGALTAAMVSLRVPGLFGLVLGLIAAMVVGALWALPAGLIKAYRGGHEVITTIMMNSVASLLTGYLVAGPFKDPAVEEPSTRTLDASQLMPLLKLPGGIELSSGLILGILATLGLSLWLRRTTAGYELQATGANPRAALFGGIRPARVIVSAFIASGALAGLAGAVQVLAYEGRFYAGFSPGYGFDALGVALLAGAAAWAVLPASLLFGILIKGGTALQIEGVPKGLTTVILGLLILIAAGVRYRKEQAHA